MDGRRANTQDDGSATNDRWPIVWQGHLVGWIGSPKIDMPHYYGRWIGAESEESAEFLEALRRAVANDEGLEVVINENWPGIVYVHPEENDGEIDIRWANLNSAP